MLFDFLVVVVLFDNQSTTQNHLSLSLAINEKHRSFIIGYNGSSFDCYHETILCSLYFSHLTYQLCSSIQRVNLLLFEVITASGDVGELFFMYFLSFLSIFSNHVWINFSFSSLGFSFWSCFNFLVSFFDSTGLSQASYSEKPK